jgi:toxin HigB-1
MSNGTRAMTQRRRSPVVSSSALKDLGLGTAIAAPSMLQSDVPKRSFRFALVSRCVTISFVIEGFRDSATRQLWNTGRCKVLPTDLHRQALKKLYILHAALSLENLKVPPGNRLEKLRGDRAGQHSIRINDKFRICFEWRDGNAHQVEIVDYH